MKLICLLLVFSLPALGAPGVAQKKQIETLLNAYVSAFDKGDIEKLKAVSTPEFLDSIGGEENLRKQIKPRKGSRKVTKLRIKETKAGTYVQFDVSSKGKVEERMTETSWLLLVNKNGWKIQRRESDFHPEEF